jgi:hypothetical protein
MSLEFQIVLGLFFVIGGVIGVIVMVMPMAGRSRGGGMSGFLKIGKHPYPYEMGDQILRYGGSASFSGIDVLLPKRMPHIFLDAHHNDKGLRPEFVFEKDNKISLEGNVDHTFQAYAPKQHKSLALSILGPDILELFIKHAYKFDVEIMEHHMRLIVPDQMISRDEKAQHELLAAAKIVMKKLDHRLKSWNESNLTGDTSLDVRRVNEHRWQR